MISAFNSCRPRVWQQQPREFFREAIIDADSTLVPTEGKCKEGAELASSWANVVKSSLA